jgi:hypothetical protein
LNAVVQRSTVRVLVAVSVLLCASGARAAEVTRVVSALDDDNRYDFNLTLAWLHEARSSFVMREDQNKPLENGTFALSKDSQYAQTRDVVDLRMDFGLLWDVGFHVAVPYVIADQRTLSFDRSAGGGCTGPPECVNSSTSTVLRDGILPGYDQSTYGLNSPAQLPNGAYGAPFMSPSSGLFTGPTRKGFESLNLGLTWAAFNQRRDDTRPTWTLNFEAKLDVFKDMRFDPLKPDGPGANTAVGPGYHRFIWSTFVSKRFRHFEPYFGAWYMLPVRTNGSIYNEVPGGNQTAINPQHRAGILAGAEQIAWENPRASQRVTVELRGRMEQYFFGRSASELWEPLTSSSACNTMQTGCRPNIDSNPGDTMFRGNPGVTETQAYASFGGDAGLNIQVGKYTRFRGLFGYQWNRAHFITYAGAGVDRDGQNGVNLNDKAEANVNYRDALDAPGRRFKVENSQMWTLYLEGSLMF